MHEKEYWDSKCKGLEQENSALKVRMRELEIKMTELESLRVEKDKLNVKAIDLERQVASMPSLSASIGSLQSHVASLSTTADILSRKNNGLEEINQKLQAKTEQLTAETLRLQTSSIEKSAHLEAFLPQIELLTHEKDTLIQRCKVLLNEVSTLKSQLEQAKRPPSKALASPLTQVVDDEVLEDLKGENGTLREELGRLQSELTRQLSSPTVETQSVDVAVGSSLETSSPNSNAILGKEETQELSSGKRKKKNNKGNFVSAPKESTPAPPLLSNPYLVDYLDSVDELKRKLMASDSKVLKYYRLWQECEVAIRGPNKK